MLCILIGGRGDDRKRGRANEKVRSTDGNSDEAGTVGSERW